LAQPVLLRAVVAAARLSLDNTRLQAQLHAQLAQVHQSRARIVAAGLQERRRVERDLHDGAQQRLLALGLTVSMMRDRLAETDSADEQLSRLADQAAGEVRESITELRELARGIHPAVLTSQGLNAATTGLTQRCPVPVTIDIAARQRWSTETETTAYYVISEALTNITKHAHARSATVRVHETCGRLQVEIRDDGIGGATTRAHASTDAVGGLPGLVDRVAALGGRLQVLSKPDQGTTVKADLPCG
jgi:signal transduction histidine kinase